MTQTSSDTSNGRDVEEVEGGDGEGSGVSRAAWTIRLVLVGVLIVIVAAVGISFARSGPSTPTDDSVAAGLARDMIDHHAQAVDMATIVQGRTTDPAIRYLATDIALTQTNQMGQMQGWLNLWNLSLGRIGPPMAWMGAGTHSMKMGDGSTMDPSLMNLQPNGLMPGMATQAQVNQLRALPPKEADVLFLKLMIAHHRGGVAMAQAALAQTKVPVVVRLCQTIVASQKLEILQMTQLLQQRS
jgi:uncharacterized protein (DUF305 family)